MILRQLLRTIIAVSENKCHEVIFLVTQHPEEQSFLFPVLWGRFQAELPAGSLGESSNSHVTVTWRQTEHQNQLVHSREDSKRSILRWVNLTSNQTLLKLGQNQSFSQERCRKTPPKRVPKSRPANFLPGLWSSAQGEITFVDWAYVRMRPAEDFSKFALEFDCPCSKKIKLTF